MIRSMPIIIIILEREKLKTYYLTCFDLLDGPDTISPKRQYVLRQNLNKGIKDGSGSVDGKASKYVI